VAYATQFQSDFDRAIPAREKVKDKIISNLARDEWELPPKPKWMRWNTYERMTDMYRIQQAKIDLLISHHSSSSIG
jgi:hypothetical protein